MDLSKLASKATELLKSEKGKKLAKNALNSVTKGKSGSLNLSSLVSLVSKNTDLIKILGAIGSLKGTAEADSSSTLKQVSSLKKLLISSVGKIDNDTFGSIVNKLLSSSTIKNKVEKIAGSGTSAFIKKAVTAFINK